MDVLRPLLAGVTLRLETPTPMLATLQPGPSPTSPIIPLRKRLESTYLGPDPDPGPDSTLGLGLERSSDVSRPTPSVTGTVGVPRDLATQEERYDDHSIIIM